MKIDQEYFAEAKDLVNFVNNSKESIRIIQIVKPQIGFYLFYEILAFNNNTL